MNIFNTIREFLSPEKYYDAENITFENPSLEFYKLDEETILDITKYLSEIILEAQKIETKKLKTKKGAKFENINDLVNFMVKAIEFDYIEMTQEKWKFEYFINHYFLDNKTICIYKKFTSLDTEMGYMVLTIISIRKFNGKYFCWTHIDD